jgi:phage-related protein
MANIYDIPEWKSTTTYRLDDIVHYKLGSGSDRKRFYWYSRVNGVTTSAPSLFNTEWGGVKYDTRTLKNKPEFIWNPSYNVSVESAPRVLRLKFGDGYEQRITDGINSNLISVSVSFDSRDNQEARAISHFLSVRKARESFIFVAPSPYSSEKLFVARRWSFSMAFYDNNNVRATFEEVVI